MKRFDGKDPEVAERIRAVRTKLGLTQVDFAKRIGTAEINVSLWESPLPMKPGASRGSLARIAGIAPYPDCCWFWDKAGVDRDGILRYAEELLAERGEKPQQFATVGIPRAHRPWERNEEGDKLLYFESKFLASASAAAYWEVDGSVPAYGVINRPGTIIALDTSVNSEAGLQSLWNKVVLLEATEDTKRDFQFPPPIGLHMGRPRCLSGHTAATHYAVLGDFEHSLSNWTAIGGHEGFPIGMWQARIENETLTEVGPLLDWELVRAKAREELRVFRGITILGRVLHWIRPPQAEEAKGGNS